MSWVLLSLSSHHRTLHTHGNVLPPSPDLQIVASVDTDIRFCGSFDQGLHPGTMMYRNLASEKEARHAWGQKIGET